MATVLYVGRQGRPCGVGERLGILPLSYTFLFFLFTLCQRACFWMLVLPLSTSWFPLCPVAWREPGAGLLCGSYTFHGASLALSLQRYARQREHEGQEERAHPFYASPFTILDGLRCEDLDRACVRLEEKVSPIARINPL